MVMTGRYHQVKNNAQRKNNHSNQADSHILSWFRSQSSDSEYTQKDSYDMYEYNAATFSYPSRIAHPFVYPTQAPPSFQPPNLKRGIIYFGVSIKPYTLLGTCAWWLVEPSGNLIASGAIPVVQKFPSKTYLEYKALFHALNCANVNGIHILTIRTTSCIVIDSIFRKFDNQGISCMNTVYHTFRELNDPLRKAFERLHHYDILIIEESENIFCQQLADRTLQKFLKRNILEINVNTNK